MVLSAQKWIDEMLCGQVEQCFEQAEWLELMDADGGRFEDGEKVEWVMDSIRRGLTEGNATMVYQVNHSVPHCSDWLLILGAHRRWYPLFSLNPILLIPVTRCFRARRTSASR